MKDLERYQGLGVFGPAYETVYRNDPHASETVDLRIQENMILLCSDTVHYLYEEYTPTRSLYERASLPDLEAYAEEAIGSWKTEEEQVASIAAFTSGLAVEAEDEELEELRFGGTEVEIIERGSDWCTDLARVGCALCQVVGIPARLVVLADTEAAYSGHMIVEAYSSGAWGAVDIHTDVLFRHPDGTPASAWDLKRDPQLIERHWRGESTPYTTRGMFRGVAISNYFVWRWSEYDYTVSGVNDYYRSILGMARRGWPGGVRWLRGEDEARPDREQR